MLSRPFLRDDLDVSGQALARRAISVSPQAGDGHWRHANFPFFLWHRRTRIAPDDRRRQGLYAEDEFTKLAPAELRQVARGELGRLPEELESRCGCSLWT